MRTSPPSSAWMLRAAALFLLAAAALPAKSPGPPKGARIAWITTRPGAEHPLAGLLRGDGHAVAVSGAGDILGALAGKPDLIVLASDTHRLWRPLSVDTLAALFGERKVLALGDASDLFAGLGVDLANGARLFETEVRVEAEALRAGPHPLSAPEGVATLWPPSRKHHFALYHKEGKPAPGLELLARMEKDGRYWPVARQGNFALWGFDGSLARMTAEGRALFRNLVAYHLAQPAKSLSALRGPAAIVGPGRLTGRLTPEVRTAAHAFHVPAPGVIEAALDWQSPGTALQLRLTGPGAIGYSAREEGRAPLRIRYEAKPEEVAKGREWRIHVVDGGTGAVETGYELNLSFPAGEGFPEGEKPARPGVPAGRGDN